jgi:hypothetical protein
LILPVLIALPIAPMLRNQGFLEDLIPNQDVNRIVVLLLCVLPFFSYGRGIMNADQILRGSEYKYAELQIKHSTVGSGTNNEYEKFKFLGFMNNFVFLMPMEGTTVIVTKFDSVDPMVLKKSTSVK